MLEFLELSRSAYHKLATVLSRSHHAREPWARFLLENKPYDPTKPVLFMHVPKCSGSSLRRALTAALKPSVPITAYDRVLFGDFNNFDSISDTLKSSIYLNAKDIPENSDFVVGHVSFSTLFERFPNGQSLTIFREPVSRLLSIWLYWRSFTDEQLLPWGGWADIVRNSRRPLADFLRNKANAAQTDNQALRMLLWPHPSIPEDDFIDERHDATLVEEAFKRLDRFSFVDVIENTAFDDNLKQWLKRPVVREMVNETAITAQVLNTPLNNELTDDCWKLLESRSRLDLSLWQAIVTRRMKKINPLILRNRTLEATISRISRKIGA